jgi:hypothetical protein
MGRKQRCTVYLDIRDTQGLNPKTILTVSGTLTDLKRGEWETFTAFVELSRYGMMMLMRGGNSQRLLEEEIMDKIAEEYATKCLSDIQLPAIITSIDKE